MDDELQHTCCALPGKNHQLCFMSHSGIGLLNFGKFAVQDAFEDGTLDAIWVRRVPNIPNLLYPHLEENIKAKAPL